jgi:hypothetical protein
MKLPTLKYLFFLMISEYTVTYNPLKMAVYYSLTLTLYKVGALLTVRISSSVKLKLYHFPGKSNVLIYDRKFCQRFSTWIDYI